MNFISCDEEEQPDVSQPVIDLVITKNGSEIDLSSELRGILDIKVSTSDDRKIASIQILIGNEVIEENEGRNVIEASLDTRLLEDGVHEIKIIALDQAGNLSQQLVSLKISNFLFSYTVPSYFIQTIQQESTNVKKWLVLSDDDGVVMEYKYMATPGTYTFLYPLDFLDAHFNLTVINQYTHVQSQAVDFSAQSILNVLPGVYIKPEPTGSSTSFNNIHTIERADDVLNHYFVVDSQGALSDTYAGEHTELRLSSSTSDLYVFDNEGPKYFYYPTIHVNETTILDFDFFNNQMIPLTAHALSVNNFDFVTFLWGTTATGEKLFCSLSGNVSDPSPIVLYYPEELAGNIFSSFTSLVQYKKIEKGFETTVQYTKETEHYLPSIEELSATLIRVPSKNYPRIDITLTGSADYVAVNLLRTNLSGKYFSWSVTSPFSAQLSFNLPQLPSGLKSEIGLGDMPAMAIQNIQLADHEDLTSYKTVLQRWLEGPSGLHYNNHDNAKGKEYKIPQ
jgi:hypothetical protein